MFTTKNNTKIELRPQKFVIIHNNFFSPETFTQISGTACKLFLLLRSYSDGNCKPVFPNHSTLANRMGCSVKTIKRAFQELENLHLITFEDKVVQFITSIDKSVSSEDKNVRSVGQNCPVKHPEKPVQNRTLQHSNKNQLTKINSTTTNKSNVPQILDKNSDSGVVVDYLDIISRVKKHPPKIKLKPDFERRLKQRYKADVIDMVAYYVYWMKNIRDIRIHNLAGLIVHICRNLEEIDFSLFLCWLEGFTKEDEKVKHCQEQDKEEYITPTPEMWKSLRKAMG